MLENNIDNVSSDLMNLPEDSTIGSTYSNAALYDAVKGLLERSPISCAMLAFYPWQRNFIVMVIAVVAVCGIFFPIGTLVGLTLLCTIFYVSTLIDRLVLFYRGLDGKTIIRISDEDARSIPDKDLPTYTILVPAYDEAEVITQLIANVDAIEYPRDKLEVMLLLEADDNVTIAAAEAMSGATTVNILKIPPAQPRTKPKACNYGMHFTHGQIVTIFDAEDKPDPLQLRRVAKAFQNLPDNTACVQAKLAFHNSSQNLLTAWFTADYALWFNFILPGLMRSTSPIPLGGTSNHLRRNVIDKIGSWDPYNVTEDADLGVRIAESGYITAVLDSETMEEANSDPINWIRQRSRWYKGYIQTWLVHMRQPLQLARSLGPIGFFRYTALLAGTPIIACLNMLFWFISLSWILGQPTVIHDQYPSIGYFPALISMVFGNMAVLYMNIIAARETNHFELLIAALTSPIYWVLMSVAAIKGTYQLIFNPSYWEKTAHGLSGSSGEGNTT